MRRRAWGVPVAVALAAACGGGGKGSPAPGACPPGQVAQGGQCVPSSNPPPVACGPGLPACGGGTTCRNSSCIAADASCIWKPPEGEFKPRIAWQWTSTTKGVLPAYRHVLATPLVVQLQRNVSDQYAPPAVVFSSALDGDGAGSAVSAVLRAVSGRDGTELWTSDPAHLVNGLSGIAAGDLDGDGFTEVVAAHLPQRDATKKAIPTTEGLVAFDHDGRFLWDLTLPTASTTRGRVFWGAPSIANLYGGGEAQVVLGATVIDARGNVVCEGKFGQGDNHLGPISAVADVDLDGIPDIVTGNTVYGNDCQPKPGWPNRMPDGSPAPDGLVAVANFTGDEHPEIVVVSDGTVRLQDWQGKVIWGPVQIPPAGSGGGGAPTVADFDGDGQLEIGVAGNSRYTVFKPFAANPVLWSRPTQDASKVTGSSVFDFQHDGRAEVVYGDECYTRVFDGQSGGTLFESKNPSCTVHENPVIADVDRDGRAEIVVGTNSVCNIVCTAPDGTTWTHDGTMHGVTVFKDLRDLWVSTRPVWNEHAYHVTNVGEDGSIPVTEAKHWLDPETNTFRMNPIGTANYAAPDLAADPTDVTFDAAACPARIAVTVEVWNRGAILVAPGVPIAVYQGAAGGAPLALARTAGAIIPGRSEVVSIPLDAPADGALDVTIVLNDDGTGQGVVGECDRTNNVVAVPGVRCPPISR